MIKGFIFDMDGVLIDSVPLHLAAWKQAALAVGINFTDLDMFYCNGLPSPDFARRVAARHRKKIDYNKFAATKDKLFIARFSQAKLFPGIASLLGKLKKQGLKIGMATASSKKVFRSIKALRPILQFFDIFITGDDFTKPRPHPEMFWQGAAKLCLSANEIVIVDDAYLGIEAAKRGGFTAIGVATYYPKNKLKKADLVVKTAGGITQKMLAKIIS